MNSVRRILKTPRSTIKSLTRQIDIQTSQPLRNIAERRCLLDALQKFGEVTTFLPGKVSLLLCQGDGQRLIKVRLVLGRR
jgi:hypothetical protein